MSEEYLNEKQLDEYYMSLALLASSQSEDPHTQTGCCIVKDKEIISLGCNTYPKGTKENDFPTTREGKWLETKYPYIIHAEVNAILKTKEDLTGAKMYITLFPCNECAKIIIQSGIKEVVYLDDKYHDKDFSIAAIILFNKLGIKYRQIKLSEGK